MNAKQTKALILVALAAILVSACSQDVEVMPAVNDENCTTEGIKSIKNKAVREEFASLCVRRSKFKPSAPGGW